jgi:hypothetical protein
MKQTKSHSDSITEYLEYEIKMQNWCRKINSKPIEYVDKINTQSIKSVKQRINGK